VLLRVAFELHFSTFADETLAALLTATAQNGATAFGGHAGTKAVLLLAGALGWTIGRAHGLCWLNVKKGKCEPLEAVGARRLVKNQAMSTIQSENFAFFVASRRNGNDSA
jgi:hypothetical protein